MHVLLLGAGFSRNWGGWLASEIIGELCGRLRSAPDIVRLLLRKRNFEDVLSQLQQEARVGDQQANRGLAHLEQAVLDTFTDMNTAFAKLGGLEFSIQVQRSIQAYLARFDAIFTLNQDLLLELHYNIEVGRGNRWLGHYFPGLEYPPNWRAFTLNERIAAQWSPADQLDTEERTQPIFKLHGSVNWRNADSGQLLVMGGSKAALIQRSPLLASYQDKFRDYLFSGDARLMVIGYSFSDQHINQMLIDAAAERGMSMYLVNPQGLDVLRPQPSGAAQREWPPLTEIPLVGVSMRPLYSTFSDDELQFASFNRFLPE